MSFVSPSQYPACVWLLDSAPSITQIENQGKKKIEPLWLDLQCSHSPWPLRCCVCVSMCVLCLHRQCAVILYVGGTSFQQYLCQGSIFFPVHCVLKYFTFVIWVPSHWFLRHYWRFYQVSRPEVPNLQTRQWSICQPCFGCSASYLYYFFLNWVWMLLT